MSNDGLDARIQQYYGTVFNEDARLTSRSAQGPLEFERTQRLLREAIPDGSRVLDVGGGTGRHAAALAARGCDVTMIDPVPTHVATARAAGLEAVVGDARALPHPDLTFDAVLLLGPLYHLRRPDRVRALHEATRVTRSGGVVAAVGLSRLVAFAAVACGVPTPHPYPPSWIALLSEGTPVPGMRFPAAHFHTPEELHEEVSAAGVDGVVVHGVEGPAGLFLESVISAGRATLDAATTLADAASSTAPTRDFSAHLLAIGRVA